MRLTRLRSIVARAVDRFTRQHMHTHAAALAYRGALALFPFLLLVFLFIHASGLQGPVRANLIRAARQATERGPLAEWIAARLAEPPDGALLSLGLLTAIWAVASGIRELRLALAVADEDPLEHTTLALWRRIALSIAIVPLAVVVVIVAAFSLLLTGQAIDTVAAWLGGGPATAEAFTWLRVPITMALIGLMLAAAYRIASGRHRTFRAVLPGATLASATWTLMSLGFSLALSTVLDYGATYGSFAAAITLLVYLQLSAAIVLLGAEVNAVVHPRPRAERRREP